MMKFLTTSELRRPEAWEQTQANDRTVVTSHGKPIAVVLPVNEGELDTVLEAISRAQASIAIARMSAHAEATGNSEMTAEEINAEIAQVRHERAASRARRR